MDMLTFLPYLLVMAGVTYLIRALPFVLVNKKNREPVSQLVSLLYSLYRSGGYDFPGDPVWDQST